MVKRVETTVIESGTTADIDHDTRIALPVRTTVMLVTLLAWLAMPTAGFGQFGPGGQSSSPPSAEDLVDVRATADVDAIEPGETFHLAFIYDIEPAWHIYWINPGVSGLPPSIDIDAPAGFEIGEIRWPRPAAIREPQGIAYGYEDTAVLFVPVTAPDALSGADVRFTASLQWLVCKEMCLMGRGNASVTIPTSGDHADPRPQSDRELVETFHDRLPKPIDALADGAEARYDSGILTVEGPTHGTDAIEFFPIELPGVQYGEATVEIDDAGDRYTLSIPVEWDENNAMGRAFEIQAVVGLGEEPDLPAYSIHLRPDPEA